MSCWFPKVKVQSQIKFGIGLAEKITLEHQLHAMIYRSNTNTFILLTSKNGNDRECTMRDRNTVEGSSTRLNNLIILGRLIIFGSTTKSFTNYDVKTLELETDRD